MSTKSDWILEALLVVAVALSASAVCNARSTTTQPDSAGTAAVPTPSNEHVNLIGAAVTMPPPSDSILGVESGFRGALLSQGMLFRVNVIPRYSQHLLDEPVLSGQQVYIVQRPTLVSGVNPI